MLWWMFLHSKRYILQYKNTCLPTWMPFLHDANGLSAYWTPINARPCPGKLSRKQKMRTFGKLQMLPTLRCQVVARSRLCGAPHSTIFFTARVRSPGPSAMESADHRTIRFCPEWYFIFICYFKVTTCCIRKKIVQRGFCFLPAETVITRKTLLFSASIGMRLYQSLCTAQSAFTV